MKHRSRFIAGVVGLLGVLAVAAVASNRIYGKLLCGTARGLTQRIPITLRVDDQQIQHVWCFKVSKRFHGGRSRQLILWLENPRAIFGRHILIVDLDRREVGIPNSGRSDYKLLGRRWLLQSEGGDSTVAFGDPKLNERNPSFQQSADVISFTIPPIWDLPSGRWNLKIDTNERL